MNKFWMGMASVVIAAGIARGEATRTLQIREDRRPAEGRAEVGVRGDLAEGSDRQDFFTKVDVWSVAPYVRYTLTKNLTLNAVVPVVGLDPEIGDGETGLGDVRLGFDLVVFRDIFDYPYIMPYAEVSLPTGDEDKGLGAGDVETTIGVAVGSTIERDWHVVFDVRYTVLPNEDNLLAGGIAVIHDLSKNLSVSAEGLIAEKTVADDKRPRQIIGGMTYRPNESWAISVHGGKEFDGRRDAIGGVKVAYLFR